MAKAKKTAYPNDVYTAILAAATGVAFLSAVYVAVMCITEFGTLFKIANG